ncbi:hypothetical protein BU24DRAFT_456880 [Aaosphaeria arxii CBS 175.79]|uniref:Uncharacterized protein n=1 Tax=Aaosphaeria arxii CBS 175.79 TaxID=1450172 RepID=A0A6A5Y5L2_9PLEO|nr:uncharacterized protein BU24DRAFT_456880 [Aaosphaeria arxii CBS 175.79]KAF2020852.1 hypothetical protein BU24DRAFT_456880 [Aaosphaeria arxii CBS 175.79]
MPSISKTDVAIILHVVALVVLCNSTLWQASLPVRKAVVATAELVRNWTRLGPEDLRGILLWMSAPIASEHQVNTSQCDQQILSVVGPFVLLDVNHGDEGEDNKTESEEGGCMEQEFRRQQFQNFLDGEDDRYREVQEERQKFDLPRLDRRWREGNQQLIDAFLDALNRGKTKKYISALLKRHPKDWRYRLAKLYPEDEQPDVYNVGLELLIRKFWTATIVGEAKDVEKELKFIYRIFEEIRCEQPPTAKGFLSSEQELKLNGASFEYRTRSPKRTIFTDIGTPVENALVWRRDQNDVLYFEEFTVRSDMPSDPYAYRPNDRYAESARRAMDSYSKEPVANLERHDSTHNMLGPYTAFSRPDATAKSMKHDAEEPLPIAQAPQPQARDEDSPILKVPEPLTQRLHRPENKGHPDYLSDNSLISQSVAYPDDEIIDIRAAASILGRIASKSKTPERYAPLLRITEEAPLYHTFDQLGKRQAGTLFNRAIFDAKGVDWTAVPTRLRHLPADEEGPELLRFVLPHICEIKCSNRLMKEDSYEDRMMREFRRSRRTLNTSMDIHDPPVPLKREIFLTRDKYGKLYSKHCIVPNDLPSAMNCFPNSEEGRHALEALREYQDEIEVGDKPRQIPSFARPRLQGN